MTTPRRMGGAGMRRYVRSDVSPPPAIEAGLSLLDLRQGTFVRASSRTYGPDLGTLVTAPANTPRWENRRDQEGPMLLLEGATENLAKARLFRDYPDLVGNPTIKRDHWRGVLDNDFVDAMDITGVGGVREVTTVNYAEGVYTTSAWFSSGGAAIERAYLNPSYNLTVGRVEFRTGTMPWVFGSNTSNLVNASRGAYIENESILSTSWSLDGMQIEQRAFPSSYVEPDRPAGGGVASPDSLTFLAGEYSTGLATNRYSFKTSPRWASGEIQGHQAYLMSFGGLEQNSLMYDGTLQRYLLHIAGVEVMRTSVVTHSRHTVLTHTVDWIGRMYTLDGASQGSGAYPIAGVDRWPTTTQLRIGGSQVGGGEAFCRFSEKFLAA